MSPRRMFIECVRYFTLLPLCRSTMSNHNFALKRKSNRPIEEPEKDKRTCSRKLILDQECEENSITSANKSYKNTVSSGHQETDFLISNSNDDTIISTIDENSDKEQLQTKRKTDREQLYAENSAKKMKLELQQLIQYYVQVHLGEKAVNHKENTNLKQEFSWDIEEAKLSDVVDEEVSNCKQTDKNKDIYSECDFDVCSDSCISTSSDAVKMDAIIKEYIDKITMMGHLSENDEISAERYMNKDFLYDTTSGDEWEKETSHSKRKKFVFKKKDFNENAAPCKPSKKVKTRSANITEHNRSFIFSCLQDLDKLPFIMSSYEDKRTCHDNELVEFINNQN